MSVLDDPRRKLTIGGEMQQPVVDKPETLTLVNKNETQIVVMPWIQWGGVSITDTKILLVFSYWMATITGKGLLDMRLIFERRLQKELLADKRMAKFDNPSGKEFQIDEITVVCLVK